MDYYKKVLVMAKRRRWIMAGPWKHSDSGIWYCRKVTPTDLKANRERLIEMGIEYKGEFHKSLGTKDKHEANAKYIVESQKIEARWEQWRQMLAEGPINLTHKQRTALAGEDGVELVERYEDNPDHIPAPRLTVKAIADNIRALDERLSLAEKNEVFEFGQELELLDLLSLIDRVLQVDAVSGVGVHKLAEAVLSSINQREDIIGWLRANKLADDIGIVLTSVGRKKLAASIILYRDKAHDTLRDRLSGDYGNPKWSKNLPEFDDIVTDRVSSSDTRLRTITLSSIIDEHEEDSNLKAITLPVTPETIRKYRTIIGQLAEFRGKDTAADIKGDEVESWKREMLRKGDLKQNTIRDKIMAIKAVLRWGNTKAKGKLFPNEFPLEYVQLPPKETSSGEGKAYTLEQARRVLKCCRLETELHLRWVPWIEAYTGMRVGEAQQLEQGDFSKVGNDWFLHIRHEGDRTTKTKRPRKVPIHTDLIEEGLIEFYQTIKQGRLFLNNSIGARLSDWFRDTVFPNLDKRPAPNHGFRHLWEDLVFANIEHRAALYITGRKSGTSLELYEGGNEKLVALTKEMKKFPSILTAKVDERVE